MKNDLIFLASRLRRTASNASELANCSR